MVWTAALVLATAVQSAPPGLQDFAIGMDIATAKAVKIEPDRHGERFVSCTDDAVRPRYLDPADGEFGVGIVRCWTAQYIGSSLVRASIDLSEQIRTSPELLFLDGRLVQISSYMDVINAAAILDALTERYGKPTGIETGQASNAYGATWTKTAHLWKLGSYSIDLVAPDQTIDRMSVTYMDATRASAAHSRLRKFRAAKIRM